MRDGCKHSCVVAIWPTVGCIWMFVIWHGIVIMHGIILVEGTILYEMDLMFTIVTSAAHNGLNVTMGYCVRFGFRVQRPDLLFLILLKCIFEMSFRFEILQDLSFFLIYGFMMPSIKYEARIMLAGSVGVTHSLPLMCGNTVCSIQAL